MFIAILLLLTFSKLSCVLLTLYYDVTCIHCCFDNFFSSNSLGSGYVVQME